VGDLTAGRGRDRAERAVAGRQSNLLEKLAKDVGRDQDPNIRQRLAELHILNEVGRFTSLRVKAAKASGRGPGPEGNTAKLLMSRITRLSRDLGLEILGPYGMLMGPETPGGGVAQELALFAPAVSIYGGSDEVQKNIIGERVLGLPAERDVSRRCPSGSSRSGRNAPRADGSPRVKLRIALTISGAVALGAYEGGALAALLCAIRGLCQGDDPAVRVDAIGGASAGSITGMLAARCLLEGIDPLYVMREAWVERDSLAVMRTDAPDEPLSLEALRRASVDLLDPRDRHGAPAHRVGACQRAPIRMVMALASLRGLEYRVPTLSARQAVRATTSLDWATFTFIGTAGTRARRAPRASPPT
jgi:hypothetical protein